ncbi:MAG: CbiX/SirB N-terminal domain-containing protein [Candidatus Cohnella colombiensis]|uniref:CbiX/SirB N-terminal domain-containing protein n=1 Tax=Candidatus Cohnella colombiensis TaxID=3121368 RepID=A0AA95EVM9_9BACL|nr:MAG: CbiX/SirB N-terminal domain-containing protein [Cohnella sp.]
MKLGVLVISHGSRESQWVSLVDQAVDAVKQLIGDRLLVEVAFLELVEGRLIQDGIHRLEAAGVEHILAIPLFVSSGSTHVDEIGWALGAYAHAATDTDLERFNVSVKLSYGQPMDDAPEIVDIIMDRLQQLSTNAQQECILLVGHGSKETGFRQAWERGIASLVSKIVAKGGYSDGIGALLQLEEVRQRWSELHEKWPKHEIIVIPMFLSEGYFTNSVIPQQISGLACAYNGCTYMPHPRIVDWIVRQCNDWQVAE